MALPKLDNTQLEKQGVEVIAKLDLMHVDVLKKLDKVSQEDTLQQMLVFTAQSADNLYNIAAKMDAQVTSFRETKKVLEESLPQMKPPVVDEGAKIEEEREKQKPKEKEPPKEKKEKSFWERLGEFLEKVFLPLIVGFVIGFSKAIGGLDTAFGKLITGIVITGILFRKALMKLAGSLLSKGFDAAKTAITGRKPELPGTGGIAGPAGSPPGVPTPEGGAPGKAAPKGPSGLDKFLQGAQKVGKSIKDLFVGIADTIGKVLGKLADGIKQFISKIGQGLKSLLTSIAKGIESFGTAKVLKGAAALVVVSGALFIAGKAFKQFSEVDWPGVAKGIVGITGLVLVMKLLEKGTISMIKGAAALTIISGALFVAGKAFQQFAEVDWKALGVAALGIIGLTAAIVGLGVILPLVVAGSAALGVMSVALLAFGAALNVIGAALPSFSEFLKVLSTLDGGQLISAAAGITAISVALAALGAGSVIGAIGNFVGKILSFGEDDIFTKLTNLGKVAGDLNQLPTTIEALGKLSNFKVSSNFMANVDLLAEGLEKIAEAAEGFEDSGDALTALARIAEALNRPAPGSGKSTEAKPADGQPAPGKPAAGPATKPADGQPAPDLAAGKPQTAPGRQVTPEVEKEAEGYEDRAAKKEQLAANFRKSGNEKEAKRLESQAAADRRFARQVRYPVDSKGRPLTEEQKLAIAEGRPAVPGPQPAPQGNVLDRTAAAAVRGATPPPAQTQGAQGPYNAADIQKQRELAAKMPEGSAGRRTAEAQLQKMESANKVAEASAQATPEQRAAVAEGRRVTPVPTSMPGEQIAADSQKVAGAEGAGAGGKGAAVVNAPSTTNVNNGQTNNLTVRPSATPGFGMWQSSLNVGLASQRPPF